MRRAILAAIAFIIAAGLAGCGGGKPPPQQMPTPQVTVIQPAKVPVRDYWHYNGYLETTKAVEVRSKIRGFLTKIEFTEGAEVAQGDPLYEIDKLEYQTALTKAKAEEAKAEADIKNWEAQIAQAKADLGRITTAVKSGAESKTELDKAIATHDVRVAERDAAIATRDAAAAARHSAEIQLGYTDIRAKIGGRISRTAVHVGNLVQADTTLLTTILKVDELYVYFDTPEPDYIAYLESQSAAQQKYPANQDSPVEVGVAKEEGYPHLGHIDFRENRVETATGTIRLRGRIANPLKNNVRMLLPGMYARVRLPKGPPTPQLAIPEDCLLSGQEGRFVFVVAADGKIEKRVVTVGSSVWKAPPPEPGVAPPSWVAINPTPPKPVEGRPPAPTRRQIKSIVAIKAGLQPGDRVVLDGVQKVRPGGNADAEEWNLVPPPTPAGQQ